MTAATPRVRRSPKKAATSKAKLKPIEVPGIDKALEDMRAANTAATKAAAQPARQATSKVKPGTITDYGRRVFGQKAGEEFIYRGSYANSIEEGFDLTKMGSTGSVLGSGVYGGFDLAKPGLGKNLAEQYKQQYLLKFINENPGMSADQIAKNFKGGTYKLKLKNPELFADANAAVKGTREENIINKLLKKSGLDPAKAPESMTTIHAYNIMSRKYAKQLALLPQNQGLNLKELDALAKAKTSERFAREGIPGLVSYSNITRYKDGNGSGVVSIFDQNAFDIVSKTGIDANEVKRVAAKPKTSVPSTVASASTPVQPPAAKPAILKPTVQPPVAKPKSNTSTDPQVQIFPLPSSTLRPAASGMPKPKISPTVQTPAAKPRLAITDPNWINNGRRFKDTDLDAEESKLRSYAFAANGFLSSASVPERQKHLHNLADFYQRNSSSLPTQNYNKGGIVYAANGALMAAQSRGTDTVPAMLTPGEFVVNREASQKHAPILQAINSGHYDHGGIVNYLNNGGIATTKYFSRGDVVTEDLEKLNEKRRNNDGVSNNGGSGGGISDQLASLEKRFQSFDTSIASLGEHMGKLETSVGSFGEHSASMSDAVNRFGIAANTVPQPRENIISGNLVTSLDVKHHGLGQMAPALENMILTNSNDQLNQLNRLQEGSLFPGDANATIGKNQQGYA